MAFDIGNQTYQAIKVDGQFLSDSKWITLKLILLVSCLTVSGSICIRGKALIIHYIHKYAKKGRPFNKLILVDQVLISNSFA